MSLELRPYQAKAVEAIWDFCFQDNTGASFGDCPTGGGKSLIQAGAIKKVLTAYPETKILCLVHSQELVGQNASELAELMPEIDYAIYSAGLGKKELKPLTFASIQSLYRKKELPTFQLCFIDEFHRAGAGTKMYMRMIKTLRDNCPNIKIVGLSATPFRSDAGDIKSEGLFTNHIFHISIKELLDGGYLAPLKTKTTPKNKVNLSKIKIKRGDYDLEHLAQEMLRPEIFEAYMAQIIETYKTRNKFLIFGTTLKHTKIMQECLIANGIDALYCDGSTPQEEREEIIKKFKEAKRGMLLNCALFTTGFNVRDIDCLAIVRATQSPVLYVQILGRASRTAPGKVNALILDYGQNIERFGPIDQLVIKPKSKEKGDGPKIMPVRMCPNCGSYTHPASLECSDCFYKFPEKKLDNEKFTPYASGAHIITPAPKWYKIDSMQVRLHKKEGSPDSIKITYYSGIQSFSEWILLDHPKMKEKARVDWMRRTNRGYPLSVDEGIKRKSEIRQPSEIFIDVGFKYPKMLNFRYATLVEENVHNLIEAPSDIVFNTSV